MSGATSAASLSTVGLGLQVAGGVTNAMGAYGQSKATKQAYDAQATVNRNNATIAEWQAQDALMRGGKAEQTQRLKTAQLAGSQRAAFAARGVALDEGSALNILNDTEYTGNLDAITIRDNAAREAWGHRVQGANYTSDANLLSARASAESPLLAAGGSLLTSAGSVADSWYKRRTVAG